MSSPISTTGTTSDPIDTTQMGGEAVDDWIARHSVDLATSTPSGDTLTTTWKSASGANSKATNRRPGEPDGVFLLRHITMYTLAMAEDPPT